MSGEMLVMTKATVDSVYVIVVSGAVGEVPALAVTAARKRAILES